MPKVAYGENVAKPRPIRLSSSVESIEYTFSLLDGVVVPIPKLPATIKVLEEGLYVRPVEPSAVWFEPRAVTNTGKTAVSYTHLTLPTKRIV